MSYSFQVRGANKAEAITKVKAELEKVVAAQPMHEADRQQTIAAAESFVALLRDDDTQDVCMSVSGSCCTVDGGIVNANVSVSTWYAVRA